MYNIIIYYIIFRPIGEGRYTEHLCWACWSWWGTYTYI